MFKHAIYCATLSLVVILPMSANANENTTSSSDQPKTMPYGDNPNIFRVLTYKTGQSISRLGNSMQRGADKSSEKISKKWQETKAFGTEQSQVAKEKTSEAKTYTEQKWQQTKDAVVGTNGGTVPIEQGNLSQSSTGQPTAAPVSAAPVSAISPTTSAAPLPESANP